MMTDLVKMLLLLVMWALSVLAERVVANWLSTINSLQLLLDLVRFSGFVRPGQALVLF